MSISARTRVLMLGVILALLLLIPLQVTSAKGLFSKITIQMPDAGQLIEVTEPAFLDFWTFSDFDSGTREAPEVIGPAYEITRWHLAADGKTFEPWDRLRYYQTSPHNTAARGWVYYEGLVNGSSEYDGKWFMSTRHADVLMESIIFADASETHPASSSEPTLAIGATALVVVALALWLIQHR